MRRLFTFFIIFSCFSLAATDLDLLRDSISYSSKMKAQPEIDNNWTPKFMNTASILPRENAFFQFNVGLGLLYFSGLRGDLSGQPSVDMRPFNYTPLKGRLSYNRTPLYESLIGYRFNPWLKLALSYQYQGGVTVSTRMLRSMNPQATGITPIEVLSQFQSNLSINALFAKVYFQLPTAFVWKGVTTQPYLALGVGPAWQSWTRIRINRAFVSGTSFLSEPQYVRQKISANPAWMVDAGFKIQKQSPYTDFSLTLGCKYNQWGQARSMGKITQQDSLKIGLIHPFSIKTVYSFAPYLGVQWNFPTTPTSSKGNFEIKGRSPKTFKPYFVGNKNFLVKKCGFTQFTVGPNFLYFIDVSGNLFGRPDGNFGIWGDVPLKGVLRANKVPILEAIWGYQFNHWIKGALSYQHFNGMTLQTKMLNGATLTGNTGATDYSQFQANVGMDAIMAKVYFEMPRSMIWRSLATMPYFAAGVGPAWQTWSQIQINRTDRDALGYNADTQPIRGKVMANAAFMLDFGFRMKNVDPLNNFSVNLGCKYNQWGQARNLGMITQQGGMIKGLNFPVRIKVLYSFAPYMGVQWSFPTANTSKGPYEINGRAVTRFKPFYTPIAQIQNKTSAFVQWNVGVGFLYFNKIRGNLAGTPASLFLIYGSTPLKDSIIYNRTPLFEYLVGYRFNQWFKAALSYQHQGGISFQTQVLNSMNPSINVGGVPVTEKFGQFQANLALDSLMAKFYFELPFSLVSKGIASSPYLAVGVGPAWQSWSRVKINRMFDAANFVGEPQNLRQKVSANCVWMLDAGFRMQSAMPCSPFSVTLGCKYNQWGQARPMGKINQQDGTRIGLWKPFKIKTVYSFAPYLGMQWNF